MCVISVCVNERVTPEQVAKMYQNNPHGAGIAYREWTDKKGNLIEQPLDAIKAREVFKRDVANAVVVWRKGMDLDCAIEMSQKVSLPYTIHFRVPSCGGPSEFLTHPFPITADIALDLEGTSTSPVLFHNGHWGKFKDVMMDTAAKGAFKIPTGKWSDSRSLAWMAYHLGNGVLEFIDEKVAVFGPGPDDIELFGEYKWTKISNGKQGIYVSNMFWENQRVSGPYFGRQNQQTNTQKKDETKASSDDSEGEGAGKGQLALPPTNLVAFPPRESVKTPSNAATNTSAGGGSQSTVPKTDSKTAGTSKGGGSAEKGPFDFYHASVRLWQNGSLSKKAFKRQRNAYEKLCKQMRVNPEDRPIKEPQPDELVDPRLTVIH